MTLHFPVSATQQPRASASRASLVLPDAVVGMVLRALEMAADRLIALGVSANAITGTCIALGFAGGVFLASGHFGPAAAVMIIASLGDALDGLVARRGRTASVGGALLDAAGDRYQEFFFLAGLAFYFRGNSFALLVTLLALAGSFMVSYSSAKAEALGVPVPPGVMRRPERAVSMCAATALMAPWSWVTDAASRWPAWTSSLPLLAAVTLIAVAGNVSAIARLRFVAERKAAAVRATRVAIRPESNHLASPVESQPVQARAFRRP